MSEKTTSFVCDHCAAQLQAPYCQKMTKNGLKRFCCEGCEGVYFMLHEEETVNEKSSDTDLHRT